MSLPVGKEGHVVFTQEGEELFLGPPHDRVVMSLVHARLRVALLLAYFENLLHLGGSVVRQAELLEPALLDSIMHGLCRLFKGSLAVG